MKPVRREDLAGVLQTLESKLTGTRAARADRRGRRRPARRRRQAARLGRRRDGRRGHRGGVPRTARGSDLRLHGARPVPAGRFRLFPAGNPEPAATTPFPPVIVYTGHELSADDEQRLRRYSNSIIIKGAKSPERLLDEVSLFLHQVVAELPPEQQKMIQKARNRDAVLEGRRILIVEDDVRNVYSLTSVLEPRGALVQIARNGQEAIDALDGSARRSCAGHRPRTDGCDDAGDGRSGGDHAPDTRRSAVGQAADHHADRQGDARRPGALHRSRAPTTTWPSRSTSTSCSPWFGCGCRDERDPCATALKIIEIQLLLEALYQRYHYDFRHYARASIKRRLAAGARSSSASPASPPCRTPCCTIRPSCPGCWTT